MIRRPAFALLLLSLSACVAPPAPPLQALDTGDSGLVIGTLTGVESAGHGQLWLERLQHRDLARQRYLLEARVQETEPAVFAGTLPAGIYQVQELRAGSGRWLPANLHMPFEVRAGAVTDAGHYSLQSEPARLRTHWRH